MNDIFIQGPIFIHLLYILYFMGNQNGVGQILKH